MIPTHSFHKILLAKSGLVLFILLVLSTLRDSCAATSITNINQLALHKLHYLIQSYNSLRSYRAYIVSPLIDYKIHEHEVATTIVDVDKSIGKKVVYIPGHKANRSYYSQKTKRLCATESDYPNQYTCMHINKINILKFIESAGINTSVFAHLLAGKDPFEEWKLISLNVKAEAYSKLPQKMYMYSSSSNFTPPTKCEVLSGLLNLTKNFKFMGLHKVLEYFVLAIDRKTRLACYYSGIIEIIDSKGKSEKIFNIFETCTLGKRSFSPSHFLFAPSPNSKRVPSFTPLFHSSDFSKLHF